MAGTPSSSVRGGYPLGLAGATAPTRYVGATTGGAPIAGTFAVGDFVIDQTGTVYVCTVAGSPGTWVAPSGAGAVTMLFDSTAGGAVASFDITPIAGTYKHLRLVAQLRGDTAATTVGVRLRVNNDSGANYDDQFLAGINATASSGGANGGTSSSLGDVPAASATAGLAGALTLEVPNYAGTTFSTTFVSTTNGFNSQAAAGRNVEVSSGVWRTTSAVTRLTIFPNAGNWVAGSRCTLYGFS